MVGGGTRHSGERDSGDGRWITPASQRRSQETLQAILGTAEQLLNEQPFDEVTIAQICRGAGCSPPSFYQRFRDKEALLHAIHERYTADAVRLIREFLDPGPWQGETVGKLVHSLVEAILEMERHSGGLRATAVRRSFTDARFADRIRTIRDELYGHLAQVLPRVEGFHAEHDPERAARFLVRLIQGAAARHFEGPHLETRPMEREELVEDLCRVALAHLAVEPDARR